jgi:uncharacterized protein
MRSGDFKSAYGPWALIAGASAGLGAAYADLLAARGINLVLVSRRKKILDGLARKLIERDHISVRTLSLDLGKDDILDKIKKGIRGLDIGLFIYNATFPCIGEFITQPLDKHMTLLNVNCRALTVLVHYFSGLMKKRKKSGIILMSSLTAFWGTPWLSHYGASKAYTLALGEGLSREMKQYNIDMLVCCPGATKTENYVASLPANSRSTGIPPMEPKVVAAEALKALGKRTIVIPGTLNRISAFFMRLIGRKNAVSIMSKAVEKLYGL